MNVVYRTDELSLYFSANRIEWDQFYESERATISRLGPQKHDTILDIGCGCGGLGLALRERFSICDYTGVEINELAAETARAMNSEARILCGDIVQLSKGALAGKWFDIVFSLSCVDWNADFSEMLAAAWTHVRPGGHLVSTFRITLDEGCDDIGRSYQYINSSGSREGEHATYVVKNASSLLEELANLGPSEIDAYGYWGSPSPTAVTPYEALCFVAMSARKRHASDTLPLRLRLDLPQDVIAELEASQR